LCFPDFRMDENRPQGARATTFLRVFQLESKWLRNRLESLLRNSL
jgi:hypothetical protein